MKLPGNYNSIARTIFSQAGKFTGLKNSSFAQATRGNAYMPDGWSVTAGTFGVDVVIETSDTLSGGRALKFPALTPATAVQVRSDLIPISGDASIPFSVEATLKYSAVPPDADSLLTFTALFYDGDRVLLASTVPPAFTSTVADFQTFRVAVVTPPVGARFVALRISRASAAAVPEDAIVDMANVFRYARESLMRLSAPQSPVPAGTPATGLYTQVLIDSVTSPGYDYGTGFDAANNQYVVEEAGLYDVDAQVAVKAIGGVLNSCAIQIVVNGTIAAQGSTVTGAELTVAGNDLAFPSVHRRLQLSIGDTVQVHGRPDFTGGVASFEGTVAGYTAPVTRLFVKLRSLD